LKKNSVTSKFPGFLVKLPQEANNAELPREVHHPRSRRVTTGKYTTLCKLSEIENKATPESKHHWVGFTATVVASKSTFTRVSWW